MRRHVRESGVAGIHFMPRAPDDPAGAPGPDPDALTRPLTEPGWERWWIAVTADGEVVGHCDLRGPGLRAELHRAILGVGLERSHRRQGIGTKLVLEAIEFAREEPALDWIDLGVFSNNVPAVALYEWIGFRRTGIVEDRFRIKGQSIDDIRMTLSVLSPDQSRQPEEQGQPDA